MIKNIQIDPTNWLTVLKTDINRMMKNILEDGRYAGICIHNEAYPGYNAFITNDSLTPDELSTSVVTERKAVDSLEYMDRFTASSLLKLYVSVRESQSYEIDENDCVIIRTNLLPDYLQIPKDDEDKRYHAELIMSAEMSKMIQTEMILKNLSNKLEPQPKPIYFAISNTGEVVQFNINDNKLILVSDSGRDFDRWFMNLSMAQMYRIFNTVLITQDVTTDDNKTIVNITFEQ